jgi:predicted nucleotidyltransferase
MTPAPFRDLDRILDILRKLNLPHALIGGWAVIAWGYLRTSEDIDFMVDLPTSQRHELLAALAEDYEAEWLAGGQDDPIPGLIRAHPRSADNFPVDIIPVRNSADRAALSRATTIVSEGVSIPVVIPEDLIAMKLEAGGGQDHVDARQLLHILKDRLDESRLFSSCGERKALDGLALLRR